MSGERIESRWSIENRSTGTTTSFNEYLIQNCAIDHSKFQKIETERESDDDTPPNLVIKILGSDFKRAKAPPIPKSP